MADLAELKRRRRILIEAMDQQTKLAAIMHDAGYDATEPLAEGTRLAGRLALLQREIEGTFDD